MLIMYLVITKLFIYTISVVLIYLDYNKIQKQNTNLYKEGNIV